MFKAGLLKTALNSLDENHESRDYDLIRPEAT